MVQKSLVVTASFAGSAPPVAPTNWWDFTDAASVSLSGSDVTAVADQQGGTAIGFAVGERPSYDAALGEAHFAGAARGTFASPFTIDHRAHTIIHFALLTSVTTVRGIISGNGAAIYAFASTNHNPPQTKIISSGDKTASSILMTRYNSPGPYASTAAHGLAAYYVVGSASATLIGNGWLEQSIAAPAALTSTAAYYGALEGGTGQTNARVLGTLYFDRALSAGEVDQVLAWGSTYYGAHHGDDLDTLIVCDGDSLTNGFTGQTHDVNSLGSYPAQLSMRNLRGARLRNVGLDGWQVGQDTTAARTTSALSANSGFSRRVVLFAGGSNDIFSAGASAAAVNSNIDAWIASVRAADAGAIVVGMTITNRGGDDADRAGVNSHILGAADFDAVVDIAADARLQNTSDTTYYHTDQVHRTPAGYAVVADLAHAVLVSNGWLP